MNGTLVVILNSLVLLGALCRDMGSDKEAWEKAIAACVKEKLLAVNLKAFEMGYNCDALTTVATK